jgi:hypothetical protein
VGLPLGVWGFIPSHFLSLPSFFSWPATLQALALVASPRLGLRHYEWFELCLVDLHGVIIGWRHHMFRLQHGWHELLQCWWWFQTFLLSTFKKSIITMHSLCNCLIQGCGIMHGQWKVLHISIESKLKLVHERSLVPWNITCWLPKFRNVCRSWACSLVKSSQLVCWCTFFVWVVKKNTKFFKKCFKVV